MSDETQLIKFIPSEALAKEFPEFNKLDIYGTTENPLIATQQFQDLLGLDRLRLDKGEYDYGEDYIQMKCKGKDGKFREQNMLTEKGLYTVLARSHTELGKKFMRFVLVVMRELRTKGQVELEDALKKLVTYDHQLTEEHHLMQKYKHESERYYLKYNNMWMENQLLKDQIKNKELVTRYDADYKMQIVEQRLFKPIWVYISKPPKILESEFEEWNPDLEPTDDEEICFQLSNKFRSTGATAEIRIMPDLTIQKIKDSLKEHGFTIQLSDDKVHETTFRGDLNNLRSVIDSLMYK